MIYLQESMGAPVRTWPELTYYWTLVEGVVGKLWDITGWCASSASIRYKSVPIMKQFGNIGGKRSFSSYLRVRSGKVGAKQSTRLLLSINRFVSCRKLLRKRQTLVFPGFTSSHVM